jgi:hypothetical protein
MVKNDFCGGTKGNLNSSPGQLGDKTSLPTNRREKGKRGVFRGLTLNRSNRLL